MCKYAKMSLFVLLIVGATFFAYYNHVAFGPHFSLSKTNFKRLPYWEYDDQSQALLAFQKSCVDILKREPSAAFSTLPQSKSNQAWQTICLAANKLSHSDKMTAQQFFESWFEPYTVQDNFNPHGLFTGYYLPLLHASLKKSKQYTVPVYGLPADLVKVNLSLFGSDFSNKIIIGQLKNNTLVPYPDRTAINSGTLGKNANVLVWADNAVDVFFAQIQGSVTVQLPDHQSLLLGYASTNGRAYTAIGKVLIQNKVIAKENISMQTIRAWLQGHPEQVNDILNQNASYVFFTVLHTQDPLGMEQVPLTAQRSLAVDTHYIPLGVPVWLKTKIPEQRPVERLLPYHRLLIAQDTGGAIKGIIRGDIYWGAGEDAAFAAGHMKQIGRYWLLLPK